jgi:phage tail sheath protein FI
LSPSYQTPGVYYERADEAPGAIPGVRTDVAGMVGVATRGPLGTAVRITSWRQYTSAFGDLTGQGFLSWAVRGFLENGGQACHVVRVAAPAVSTRASPDAPQPADGASSLVVPEDGFPPGAVVTVVRELLGQTASRLLTNVAGERRAIAFGVPLGPTFDLGQPVFVRAGDGTVQVSDRSAVQPRDGAGLVLESTAGLETSFTVTVFQPARALRLTRQVVAATAGGVRLTWNEPLAPDLVPGSDLVFEAGAAAASEVFLGEQGEPLLDVSASTPGAWGNGLLVRVGRQVGAVGQSLAVAQPRDRMSSLVGDVSGFGPGDLVRVWQAGARPAARHVVVADALAGEGRLTWTAPLPASLDLSRRVTFERVDLNISASLGGALLATYPRLSLREEHPRFAPRVLAADPAAPIQATSLVDAGGDADLFGPLEDERRLVGGRDGLASVTAADMVEGVNALAAVDEVAMLAAPDAWLRPRPARVLTNEPPAFRDPCMPGAAPPVAAPPPPAAMEQPPAFSSEDAFAVQRALVEQAELLRDRVALLDAPRPADSAAEGTSVVRDWRRRFDSAFAALHFPWVHVRDPISGAVRELPPSGHVTGLAALTDLDQGVHRAPANRSLRWVQSVSLDLDDARAGLLNSEAVNVIRAMAGRGIRPMGARTLSSDPSWRYLPVRRLFSMIEKSVVHATQWTVFEPNDGLLRETVRLGIIGLLRAIFDRGALAGRTPDESYFVRCDGVTTPPALAAAGELLVEVGVAPASPSEFVVFRVGRVGDQVQVIETSIEAA